MSATLLALAALIASSLAPVLLAIVTTRERRAETRERWDHEDAMAAGAAAAAATQRLHNAAVAEQLDAIHSLLDSELTQAQQRELDAARALLARSQEVIDLRRGAGTQPSVAEEDHLLELEIRITAMAELLATRAAHREDDSP